MLSFALYLRTRKNINRKERKYTAMMEAIIGAAALVPSLYWTAVVAASVKNVVEENK